jgi:hypothetical protein
MRIDLETGDPTGYVDVPSPCGHAGGLAVGGYKVTPKSCPTFAGKL